MVANRPEPTSFGILLVEAAFKGDAAKTVELLMDVADVDSRDWSGNTPLIVASAAGHLNIVKMLVELKADLRARDDFGNTPFDRAAAHGHREIMKFLHDHGASKNAEGQFGRRTLEWVQVFRPQDAESIKSLKRGEKSKEKPRTKA